MRVLVPLACLVLVTACATPQERCARRATSDLRTLTALIGETEANIARGFAYREELRSVNYGLTYCAAGYGGVGVRLCADNQVQTVRRPVAIDLDAERQKLAGLRDKRAELETQAAAAIRACNAIG